MTKFEIKYKVWIMETLEILAVIAAIVGIIGSIVPALPGPPVSWVGMLLVFFARSDGRESLMSPTFLFGWLAAVIIVSILDYYLPVRLTTVSGGHKGASVGAMVGLFAGIFLTPIGMVTGSFIGAFIGELLSGNQDLAQALKAALATFVGFILTTGIKVITSCVMAWYIFDYIF